MSGGISFDAGPSLADRFRRWAGDSRRVYPYAVRAMADDWEAGGPVREVCAGYENAPAGAVIQLRLLAGVFRLVLTGRADELRPLYPCLGGTADPAGIWPVLREVIAAHTAELHEALEVAPQTNEVGRCVPLLIGLSDLITASGRSRIRLLEVGASGGLNLLVDRYRVEAAGWSSGPPDSPLRLVDAVEGDLADAQLEIGPLRVVGRRGCDLHPIDPSTAEGRLRLTSFVWPDDVHRFERLRGALAVVAAVGAPTVDRAPAADWLAEQLGLGTPKTTPTPSTGPVPPTGDHPGPAGDELVVIWNSITEQYWPPEEVARVAELVTGAGATRPLARVSMEFSHDADAGYPELRTMLWSGDGSPPRERLLGHAHHHGVPVYLDA